MGCACGRGASVVVVLVVVVMVVVVVVVVVVGGREWVGGVGWGKKKFEEPGRRKCK